MRPIHPGEVLREEFLIPLNLTAHALALALHVPAPRINDIVREHRAAARLSICNFRSATIRMLTQRATARPEKSDSVDRHLEMLIMRRIL